MAFFSFGSRVMNGGPDQSAAMISVIICSIDPSKFERTAAMYRRLLDDGPFEIIGIHDARGMAEGYNRGMSQSSGSILIFSHDDVEFLASDFRARVVGHMSQHDVLGVLGTVRLTGAQWWNGSGMPYVYGQMAYKGKSGEAFDVLVWSVPTRAVGGIQAMDGMFLCVRRNVLQLLQFDADSFPGKTGYDVDFTYRAHRQGLRLSVANHLYPICASLPAQDADWIDSARRFDRKYEGQLPVHLRQRFQVGIVSVYNYNREEILDVMSPPHWKTRA